MLFLFSVVALLALSVMSTFTRRLISHRTLTLSQWHSDTEFRLPHTFLSVSRCSSQH